jgi:putative tricarboxylic transport membrane protein
MEIENTGLAEPVIAAPERPAARTRTVDIVVSILIFALACLLAWDSDRTGNEWAADGPEAGYFPFYLSVLMGAAALYGLGRALLTRIHEGEVFVTREQLYRVMQVFIPTLLFCFATDYLGIYVASFILTAGFMIWIGKIAAWKSILTAFLFSAAMFYIFEIAFNVIMPKGPLEAFFGY